MEQTLVLIPLISKAYEALFKQAEVLQDLQGYQVNQFCRSSKEMLMECVHLPIFLSDSIRAMALAPVDENTWEHDEFVSLEACKASWEKVEPDLSDAIRNFPPEKLSDEIATPWGTYTWRDFIAFCYWNPIWHAGQMAYIQMIHADEKMH